MCRNIVKTDASEVTSRDTETDPLKRANDFTGFLTVKIIYSCLGFIGYFIRLKKRNA